MKKWGQDRSAVTGEKVVFHKVMCDCGHSLSFLSNHFIICGYCGKKVYPTKKSEFKDKLMKEIKKYEQSIYKG